MLDTFSPLALRRTAEDPAPFSISDVLKGKKKPKKRPPLQDVPMNLASIQASLDHANS